MSNSTEGEGKQDVSSIKSFDSSKAPAQKPMTEAQRMQQEKIKRKQAEVELADYMKRLRKSNDVKQMQTDEMRLGVEYYEWKVKFRELRPKMDELDVIEAAERKEQEAEHKKTQEDFMKLQEKLAQKRKDEKEKPDIVIPKTGTPRSKE